MSDRTAEIESRIDKAVAGGITVSGERAGTLAIMPRNMGELMEFAKMMSISGPCVRPAFRGNPGACLAIALQAMKWGADPFAVSNKAYITRNSKTGEEQIAYEAQLVHAIVNSCGPLTRRLRATYDGQGATRRCKIVGWVKGEDEPLEYTSPTVQQIAVKNSPLWQGDPDQQLFYYSSRAWARRHVPEVLLGIYTPDEVAHMTIDMTPTERPQEVDGGPPGFGRSTVTEDATPEPWVVYRENGEGIEFRSVRTAFEAMQKILDATAKAGKEALMTVWDNNLELIEAFDATAGSTESVQSNDLREQLEKLLAQFQPKGGDATDAGKPKENTVDTPPPSDEVGAGVLPRSELNPAMPEGAAVPRNEAATVNAGQSAAKHDPFWDGASLKIDPPTVKKGARYVIDWPRWPALILPKIRQAWSGQLVNSLWADNGENMDLYTQACGDKARDDLSWEFELARERFK